MPYRRLPNTDKARIRAIETALGKAKVIPQHELAFKYLSLIELQAVYPLLSSANNQLNKAKESQFSNSKEYAEIYRKAKLYVSHFMQVLNFSIIRGELKADIREYYGLKVNLKRMPNLIKEEDIFIWGRKLIDGDAKRTREGGNPLYNPSIAMVRVHYEKFEEAYTIRKSLQKQTGIASGQMSGIRERADKIILTVWNEVEAKFSTIVDDEIRRKSASEYGVTYVYRPKEIKQIEADKLQKKFEFA